MAVKYQAFPGMDDILPGDVEKWQWLEQQARSFFESRGLKEIRTPVLEPTELFIRSIGETSDIVHKEMYTFEDRGARSMTMRPEMTASVGRSVVEHHLIRNDAKPRLFYIGPMFRAERPQAGRKRQFHQLGVEMVNQSGAASDFEIITILYDFLVYTGIKKPRLRLNDLTVINGPDSEKVKARLKEYLSAHKDKLDEDSLYRLDKNVLRIFDSKNPDMQPLLNAMPWDEAAPLSEDFRELLSLLEKRGIPYELNRRLVRGLDYYTGAVFEIALDGLGAQDAVAGGGRYDNLYSELGAGSPVPCTGFSIGMERLLMVLESDESFAKKIHERRIYVALMEDTPEALKTAEERNLELCRRGFKLEYAPHVLSFKNHLKKANQAGARWMAVIGGDEFSRGNILVKDLDQRQQQEIKCDELAAYLEGVVRV